MRRSRLVQTTAATLALLFLAALATEAYGLHACPRHHRSGADPTSSAGPTVSPENPEGDPAAQLCVCVGSCHGGAASPVPAGPVARDLPKTPPRPAAAPHGHPAPPRLVDAYFLPFPNGPPLG